MSNFRGLVLPRGVLTRTSHITLGFYHFTEEKSIVVPHETRRKKYGKTLQDLWIYRIVQVAMKRKQKIGLHRAGIMLLAVLGMAFSFALTAPSAYAEPSETVLDDPVAGNDCGGVKTAIVKCDADNSGDLNKNGIWALLLIVINVMTVGVGVLAVAGIVYGSILYTTAEDKADQVNKAVDIIRNVIIGLIAFALMWALLNFIIPGGVFSK